MENFNFGTIVPNNTESKKNKAIKSVNYTLELNEANSQYFFMNEYKGTPQFKITFGNMSVTFGSDVKVENGMFKIRVKLTEVDGVTPRNFKAYDLKEKESLLIPVNEIIMALEQIGAQKVVFNSFEKFAKLNVIKE